MLNNQFLTYCFIVITLLLLKTTANAALPDMALTRLQQAYPEQIQAVSEHSITWRDNTVMSAQEGQPNLYDQLSQTGNDVGRLRYIPFFNKMYGGSEQAVIMHLTFIYWLPEYFGHRYPLLVTTVNHVDTQLKQVSMELSSLVKRYPDYLGYLTHPAGTFKWRLIANTNRVSPHSFGIAIDLNTTYSDYWQWDLHKQGLAISESAPLTYHNKIPSEIVAIFAKHHFIWGGHWMHYDTMHFEYRPELLTR